MAKKSSNKQEDGFITLKAIPGGDYDRFLQGRKSKSARIPKNPDKMLNRFVDEYGVEAVVNMQEVNLGDYVYDKGITHSLNMNVGRNIPWIEDGLKAVERRVLFIMYRSGLYRGKFDKVAGVSGDMIKHVHPHGEQSANDTIYRLGRSRTMMIPYIKPMGNFGNMDTMRPAASRYASASLSAYAMDCFFSEMGAKYPIFDVKDNYKYSDKEPVFLTSRYPNILMQWNQGIGKGAATWLGAFNSKDLLKVAIKMLDDPDCKVDIYPDTPIPVNIINKADMKGCFDKTDFKVKMRAPYKIVGDKRRDEHGKIVDKYTIVFTSLPLSVKGDTVKNEIIAIKEADQKRGANKRLPEILNVEVSANNTTPGGIEFIVEYEKGYDPDALAEKLYRSTSLGKTVGVRYVLISDNKPDIYTPRQIMKTWITQRYDQKRRYYHQQALKAAKDRSRLEAICTILENPGNIDKAINLIRKSKNDVIAVKELMREFDFTEFQANCVIQISLKNLPKMNIEDTKKERDQALETYKHYRKLLSDENAIKDAIRDELEDGLKKYGKDRMANVYNQKEKDVVDPTGSKYLVYNYETYYALNDLSELKKLKNRADNNCKVIQFQNNDSVLMIGKNGMTKQLDGFAFNINDGGIGMIQLGLSPVVNVIPITKTLTHVVLVTTSGFGKIMEIDEILKSTKSKLMSLSAGDSVAVAIPLYNNTLKGMIAMYSDAGVYFSNLEDYPMLKRTAAGNRIFKFDLNTVYGGSYIPENTTELLIYSEFGFIKSMKTNVIKTTRRNPKAIAMEGRTISGIIPISNGTAKITMYDYAGVTEMDVEVGKMVKMTAEGSKESIKFRLGTTISAPTKVLKKGRGEFCYFRVK